MYLGFSDFDYLFGCGICIKVIVKEKNGYWGLVDNFEDDLLLKGKVFVIVVVLSWIKRG